MTFVDVPEPFLAFERHIGERRILCVFNLGAEERGLDLPVERLGTSMEGHGLGHMRREGRLCLPVCGAYFGDVGRESADPRPTAAGTDAA